MPATSVGRLSIVDWIFPARRRLMMDFRYFALILE
jgi:hypothetical protein